MEKGVTVADRVHAGQSIRRHLAGEMTKKVGSGVLVGGSEEEMG